MEQKPEVTEEQQTVKLSPRDEAIKALQERTAKAHGDGTADFLIISKAQDELFKTAIQLATSAVRGNVNPGQMLMETLMLAQQWASARTDSMVAYAVSTGRDSEDQVAAFLDIGREHLKELDAILRSYNHDGSVIEASNDDGGNDAPTPALVLAS